MMAKLYSKVKSNKGASLMLVLLLFLMCVMVSSVIVTIASVGASRNAYRKQQQQAYLAVVSAARFVAGEFVSPQFAREIEQTDYECNREGELKSVLEEGETVSEETPVHEDITEVPSDTLSGAGIMTEVLSDACAYVADYHDAYPTTSFTISTDDDENRLPEVTCEFFMDIDYDITMKFTAEGSDYEVTLFLKAGTPSEITTPDLSLTECFHDIYYWLEDGDEPGEPDETREYEVEKSTTTLTVDWSSPTVQKGAD